MTALQWLAYILIGFLGIGLLGVIVIALLKKDRVKASVWWRSSGFLLEADNTSPHSGPTIIERPNTGE
jgi:hypothetical protein